MSSESKQEIFCALEEIVDRYLQGQAHRSDYESWRAHRLRQEEDQQPAIETLRLLFQSRLPELRILDIGAGMGGYPVGLRLAGLACDGIEFNPDYVHISGLRARLHDLEPMVRLGRIEALPVVDATYDVVHCHDVLEHCEDPEKGLKEMARVLKPGGVALVTFINRFAWKDPHYHLRGVNWLPRKLGSWLAHKRFKKNVDFFKDNQRLDEMHYFSAWKARALVGRSGFSRIENVRCIKLRAYLEKRFSFLKHPLCFWITAFATALFRLWEYSIGQNYYWMISISK